MVLNKIGLTGAKGMLGCHLRTLLEKVGSEVVSLSRESEPINNVISWNLKDWKSFTDFDLIFKDVQAVVHLGAMLPGRGSSGESLMFDVNVRSSLNLGLWAAERKVPIVYVSGAIVYKNQEKIDLDENEELGWNELGGFYGFSKLLSEDVLKRLCQSGLKLAVVRPSSIYGFGLPESKMVASFLNKASEGEVISLVQPVNDRINFIHAADVSLAILAILRMDAWDTFNIASSCLTVKELAEACISVAGSGSLDVDQEKSPERAPINRFALKTGRAKTCLGWQSIYDVEQGLEMMLKRSVYLDFTG
jgi:UDP-glucose 4-epimerase